MQLPPGASGPGIRASIRQVFRSHGGPTFHPGGDRKGRAESWAFRFGKPHLRVSGQTSGLNSGSSLSRRGSSCRGCLQLHPALLPALAADHSCPVLGDLLSSLLVGVPQGALPHCSGLTVPVPLPYRLSSQLPRVYWVLMPSCRDVPSPSRSLPDPSRCVCVPVLGADFPSLCAYSSPSPFLTAAAVPFLLIHEGPVQMRFPRHHLPLRPVLSSWSRELISGVCVPSLTVHVTVLSPSWVPGSFIRNLCICSVPQPGTQ